VRNGLRALILVSLVAAAAIAVAYRARTGAVVPSVRLSPVATAHQLGPVGYRDPAGAISPDGRWIAYSEGRFLRVQPIGGGSIIELPPGDGQIRHLVWHPDSRTILADGDVART
jgi:hypothetical protein